MDKSLIETLAERVERLERKCRVWRFAGIGTVAFVTLVALAGSARQAEVLKQRQFEQLSIRELEAERIILKDEQGRRWFSLKAPDGIPQMAFEGPPVDGVRGTYHIQLVVNRDGVPYMTFTGKDSGGVMLGVSPKGDPHLSLSGKSGAMTVRMGEDGPPQLLLWDKEGRQRVRLGLKSDGSGGVEVWGEKEAPRSPQPRQTK